MKLHPNIKYRSDIDGLRAIAVLSVIIFHINEKWIPGGFLGVDIFFVISGYLITLILTKEVDATNKINITNFYQRRLKRIIPALLFVLIPTFIVGFMLFTPDDLISLSKSMVWAFFSAANIYFFSAIDTGYFAIGSSELPLLHLWSLGIEEQFYILWPFAVLLILKYVTSIKKRIFITSVLFVGSLVWAQLIIVTNHSFAYYMLPTRSWELLGGAMVALLVHNGFRVKNIISEIMAFIGLFTIILSFIFVSESDPVPGIAALPVILGASLLILSGVSHKTYIGRILSFKIFIAIGLVSYSAYLWHWPVLAYLRYALIEIDINVAIFVLFFTFIMATISYFFIETPLRKNNINSKKVFLFYFILPAIIIATISMDTVKSIKSNNLWIYSKEKLENLKSDIIPAYKYKYNCQYPKFYTNAYKEEHCIYPLKNEPSVFLVGDSNAAHYLGMIQVFSDYYGFTVRNATQSACPLIFDGEYSWIKKKYQEGCSIYRHSVKEQALKYSTVIIGGSWNQFDNEEFKQQFIQTVDELSLQVKKIIILAKVPLMPRYNKDCSIRSIVMPWIDCSKMFNNKQNDISINLFIKELTEKYTNVDYFDIRNQLCKGDECTPYLESNPLYYDEEHLSMIGSKIIGEEMLKNSDPMLEIFEDITQDNSRVRLSNYVDYEKMQEIYERDNQDTKVEIIENDKNITFSIVPGNNKFYGSSPIVAFYLYKNNKRIDTQMYSEKMTYVLNKKEQGNGEYKVTYFIVDKNSTNPSKSKNKERGSSNSINFDKGFSFFKLFI